MGPEGIEDDGETRLDDDDSIERTSDGDDETQVVERLGRYRLLDVLGSGGMGVVFRAYDPRLKREVALKRLRTRVIEREGEVRLLREAHAMARLNHPNVVAVYDVEEIGTSIIVSMEYVEGRTLDQWLGSSRSWVDIVRVFRAAGRGLAAAHAAGLVHRDFKPTNVLIGDDERVRVVDFGLARGAEPGVTPMLDHIATLDPELEQGTLGVPLTDAGAVMGTPRYMAPEQLGALHIDARSDQYAFCVALWEALFGQAPFSASNLRELARKKRTGPPTPPKGRTIPRWLERVLLRGLAPDPRERFPDMSAVLAALGDGRRERRRRRLFAVSGLSAVVSLGIGGGMWATHRSSLCNGAAIQVEPIWGATQRGQLDERLATADSPIVAASLERAKRLLDDYADQWVSTHTEACRATALRGEQSDAMLDLRMACLHRAKMALHASSRVLLQGDRDVALRAVEGLSELPSLARCSDIEDLLSEVPKPADPELASEVKALESLWARADALRWAGLYAEGFELMDERLASIRALDHRPSLARAELRLGMFASQLGWQEQAREQLLSAYETGLELRMHPLAAEAAANLAFMLSEELAEYEQAEIWARTGLALATPRQPGIEASNLLTLATIASEAHGDSERAIENAHRAIEMLEQAMGPEHPRVAVAYNNLGNLFATDERYQEAREAYQTAMDRRVRVLGPEHPHVATSYTNLGNVMAHFGELDQAEEYQRKALSIRTRALGSDHPTVADAFGNLAVVLAHQGKLEDAERMLRSSIELLRSSKGRDTPSIALALTNLGAILRRAGRLDEAEAAIREAVTLRTDVFGEDSPFVADTLNNLGLVSNDAGRRDDAIATYRRGLEIYRRALAPGHPRAALITWNLAWTLAEAQEYEEALVLGRDAADLFEQRSGADAEWASIQLFVGKTSLHLGRVERAFEPLEEALAVFSQPGHELERAAVRIQLARARLEQGDLARARSLLLDVKPTDDPWPASLEAEAHFVRALLHAEEHDVSRARQEVRLSRSALERISDEALGDRQMLETALSKLTARL